MELRANTKSQRRQVVKRVTRQALQLRAPTPESETEIDESSDEKENSYFELSPEFEVIKIILKRGVFSPVALLKITSLRRTSSRKKTIYERQEVYSVTDQKIYEKIREHWIKNKSVYDKEKKRDAETAKKVFLMHKWTQFSTPTPGFYQARGRCLICKCAERARVERASK